MRWEDLTVCRPLGNDALKPAFRDFTQIVARNLRPFGFTLRGRKLVAISNDLIHVIHIDTRNSWSGPDSAFKLHFEIAAVSDKSPFIRKFEPWGRMRLDDSVPRILQFPRVTQEYPLLVASMTEVLISDILPRFDRYDRSSKILEHKSDFATSDPLQNHEGLILHCELQNGVNLEAGKLVDKAPGSGRPQIS